MDKLDPGSDARHEAVPYAPLPEEHAPPVRMVDEHGQIVGMQAEEQTPGLLNRVADTLSDTTHRVEEGLSSLLHRGEASLEHAAQRAKQGLQHTAERVQAPVGEAARRTHTLDQVRREQEESQMSGTAATGRVAGVGYDPELCLEEEDRARERARERLVRDVGSTEYMPTLGPAPEANVPPSTTEAERGKQAGWTEVGDERFGQAGWSQEDIAHPPSSVRSHMTTAGEAQVEVTDRIVEMVDPLTGRLRPVLAEVVDVTLPQPSDVAVRNAAKLGLAPPAQWSVMQEGKQAQREVQAKQAMDTKHVAPDMETVLEKLPPP